MVHKYQIFHIVAVAGLLSVPGAGDPGWEQGRPGQETADPGGDRLQYCYQGWCQVCGDLCWDRTYD